MLTGRYGNPGCVKVGDQVIIAGGRSEDGYHLKSVELLDVKTHEIQYGAEMVKPREYFSLVSLQSPHQRVLAIGGHTLKRLKPFSSVEEYSEGEWREVEPLGEELFRYGAVVIPVNTLCGG